MREDNKLSNKQIRALVVSTMVGISILSLPSKLAMLHGNDGWIPIILAGLLTLPAIIVINKIFQLYPDMDFLEIGEAVLGKWVFKIFLLILLVYFIGTMSFLARNLAELVKAFLLETTPTEVIILTFILATAYIARDDIQVIGRAAYHIYPIIIGFVIFMIIVSLPEMDFTNMLPSFQSNMKNLPRGISSGFMSYIGFEVLLFALPFAEKKEENMKYSLTGVGIVIAIYLLMFVLSIGHYGEHSLKRQIYPSLSLIKEIDLPGLFLENLDGLAMAIWVIIIFATMAPAYYSAGKVLSGLFKTRDHSLFITPILPLIYIISLLPPNIIALERTIGRFVNFSSIISIIILPILIYLVGRIRTRGRVK